MMMMMMMMTLTCERVATTLQQERKDPAAAEGKEWGEFLHRAGERFYDFMEIRCVRVLDVIDHLIGRPID